MDPELTLTLPAWQTAAGVTDMISHVLERFFSGEPAVAVTDGVACALVRAAMEAGTRAMEDPGDYEARREPHVDRHAGAQRARRLRPQRSRRARRRPGPCHGLEHELSARRHPRSPTAPALP